MKNFLKKRIAYLLVAGGFFASCQFVTAPEMTSDVQSVIATPLSNKSSQFLEDQTPQSTIAISTNKTLSTLPEVSGFQFETGNYCPHEVVLNPIPPIFETHPQTVQFPTVQTPEGVYASPELAANDLIVRNIFRRSLDDWVAFGIKDNNEKYVAIWVGHPRNEPSSASLLSLEGVLASLAEPAIVRVTKQTTTSATGITCFPPKVAHIRGFPVIILRQEQTSQGSSSAVNTLVWREEGMYWKLSTSVSDSLNTPYDLNFLLETVKNGLSEYDRTSGKWVNVQ